MKHLPNAARLTGFVIAGTVLPCLSGCSAFSSSATTEAQATKSSVAILQRSHMPAQAKNQMMASIQKNASPELQVQLKKQQEISAQQQNANIERITADPGLSAEDKRKFIEQERAKQ